MGITRHGSDRRQGGTPGPSGNHVEDLAVALQDEARVVKELGATLKRQRDMVAANDYQAVEDSVLAMSRITLTLEEARRRRMSLTATITGGSVGLGELEQYLDDDMPENVVTARDALRTAAARAAEEIAVSQRVLRGAIDAGHDYLQRLFSWAAAPEAGYPRGDEPDPPHQGGGLLLNRTA